MANTLPLRLPVQSKGADNRQELPLQINERRTPELVIGLVGPIGAGVSTTASRIANLLTNRFNYEVEIIKASDRIIKSAHLISESYDSALSFEGRIRRLQDIGNKLRKEFSPNFVVEKCIERIAMKRKKDGFAKNEGGSEIPKPLRIAHIIDSLKNPLEADLLKRVYGDLFWLIAVFAPADIRKGRLQAVGYKDPFLTEVFSRDEYEEEEFGQKVRDTSYLADFFVRNDGQNTDELDKTLKRFFSILFFSGVRTPTLHESAMYQAAAVASRSACLSRQVGAAIVSNGGELLGVGCNDVPKAKGRLYCAEDGSADHRCFKWGGKICHNDDEKEKLYRQLFDRLRGKLSEPIEFKVFRDIVRSTDIRNLIEFSRSVHAEMEAIVSVARAGKGPLEGAILYTTTFPCHNCARHIVASGIVEVYYVEPYAKSLALSLHSDSISTSLDDRGRVRFLQYEGLAPKNVLRLFAHGEERKRDGRAVECDRKTAFPVTSASLDDFTRHEKLVVADLFEREGTKGTGA